MKKTKGSLSLRQIPWTNNSNRKREIEQVSHCSVSPLKDDGSGPGTGSGTLSRGICTSTSPSSHWLLFSYQEFRDRHNDNQIPTMKSLPRGLDDHVRQSPAPLQPITIKRKIEETEGNQKHWECGKCTLLNDLEEERCTLCGFEGNVSQNPVPRKKRTIDVSDEEVETLDCSHEESVVSDSEVSEWEEGSDSNLGEEEEAKIEEMFAHCIPAPSTSKQKCPHRDRPPQSTPEIVDLTDFDQPRGSNQKSVSVPGSRSIEYLGEDIEDFVDDAETFPCSHPFLAEHFRTVSDLRRGGYTAIDFTKFVLNSNNSRSRTIQYESRREKREGLKEKKKRRDDDREGKSKKTFKQSKTRWKRKS